MTGRTGLWLIGARGSVATTATAGLLALRAGLVEPVGCVTATPPLDDVALPGFDDLVIGGHDIVDSALDKRAELLAEGGVLPYRVVEAVRDGLRATERELRHGYHPASHRGPQADAVERLADDLRAFRERHNLRHVVVIDVSSTEPPAPELPEHHDLDRLREAVRQPDRAVLTPSSLTAYAALLADCPVVMFTPSSGARLPALLELAAERGLPVAGSDGKTGETLVKTTLAPMFTSRGLRVRSWSGTNLLGGGDGATLENPQFASSKLESKARGMAELLGADVAAPLHIDNVPDLGDWKTAWDHVSFEGFLGVRMTMQFTWNGCDSALAAPLVIDLTRLLAAANEAGRSGPIDELGFFFKAPMTASGGPAEHRLAEQTRALYEWAAGLRSA